MSRVEVLYDMYLNPTDNFQEYFRDRKVRSRAGCRGGFTISAGKGSTSTPFVFSLLSPSFSGAMNPGVPRMTVAVALSSALLLSPRSQSLTHHSAGGRLLMRIFWFRFGQ